MADGTLAVNPTGASLLHTNTRTIGGSTNIEEYTLPAEYAYATYDVAAGGVSTATAGAHLLEIMAGASNPVRIRAIRIDQASNATAVNSGTFSLVRLTSAGTGGTVFTPQKRDTGDAAAGATVMTLPTVAGTEAAAENRREVLILRQALLATAAQSDDFPLLWQPAINEKPYIIAAGTANGFAVKNITAVAGATVNIVITFVETTFT